MFKLFRNSVTTVIIFFTLFSCATLRADIYLYQNTTPEDKALMLYEHGLRLYNVEVEGKQDYSFVPSIVQNYSDAFKIDPKLVNAKEKLNEITIFREEKFSQNVMLAKKLFYKQDRTKNDNYELVLAVKRAKDLKIKNNDLKLLIKDTKDLKEEVILNLENSIVITANSVIKEEDHNQLLKLIKQFRKESRDLLLLSPDNISLSQNVIKIETYINRITLEGIEECKILINEKDFIKAELTLRQVEQKYLVYFSEISSELKETKFELFVNWSENLLNIGNLQLAKTLILMATDIRESDATAKILSKIEKANKNLSVESSISSIIESINYYINLKDPLKAINLVNSSLQKITNKDSRSKITAKISEIESIISSIYKQGIEYYNDEDYERALQEFAIVVKYNRDYMDVKAYYDRTDTKVKALSGSF